MANIIKRENKSTKSTPKFKVQVINATYSDWYEPYIGKYTTVERHNHNNVRIAQNDIHFALLLKDSDIKLIRQL